MILSEQLINVCWCQSFRGRAKHRQSNSEGLILMFAKVSGDFYWLKQMTVLLTQRLNMVAVLRNLPYLLQTTESENAQKSQAR